jgi:CO dehydrogenase/acetyl-CoA synthase delta subunit
MALEMPKQSYSGKIREVQLGAGDRGFKVGGAAVLPFHTFEGAIGHAPRVAMEVNDVAPAEWAAPLREALGAVVADPVAWARFCVEQCKVDLVHLELVGTDPNGLNRSAAEAAATAKAIVDAVSVPVAVWGSGNEAKDADVLRAVAEACQGKRLLLGPVVEGNHKQLGAATRPSRPRRSTSTCRSSSTSCSPTSASRRRASSTTRRSAASATASSTPTP